MTNLQLSEQYIAHVLVKLYESWPMPSVIHAESITGISFDTDLMFEGQSAPREWELFVSVINWLRNEDFIRSEGCYSHIYEVHGVVLSLKALEAMKKVPDPLSVEKRTLVDALRDAVSEGRSSAIHSLVNASMTAVYKALSD